MYALSFVALSLVLAACGDNSAKLGPDAGGGGSDAPTSIDAPVDACSYREQSDTTNDDVGGGGMPELTAVAHEARTTICGSFASDHFDGDITVDIDSYSFAVDAPGDVLLRMHGAGSEGIEFVGVDLYGGPSLTTLVGSATFYGDHGVSAFRIEAAGTYAFTVFALGAEAIAAPVPYVVELVADDPDARCATVASGGYAEQADGAANSGNDVVTVPSGAPPKLTMNPADMPEPSGLVIDATTRTRVTGSLADIAAPDQYEDKDTFAFTAGPSTNELAVRLDWPSTTANLDFLLFEAGNALPVFRAIDAATSGPEVRTVPVKPGAAYWLLVGAKGGATNLPAAYTASVCGATFTP